MIGSNKSFTLQCIPETKARMNNKMDYFFHVLNITKIPNK